MTSRCFGCLGCFLASAVIATPGGKGLVWRGGTAVQRRGEQVGALQWASESLAVPQPHTGMGSPRHLWVLWPRIVRAPLHPGFIPSSLASPLSESECVCGRGQGCGTQRCCRGCATARDVPGLMGGGHSAREGAATVFWYHRLSCKGTTAVWVGGRKPCAQDQTTRTPPTRSPWTKPFLCLDLPVCCLLITCRGGWGEKQSPARPWGAEGWLWLAGGVGALLGS